MHDVGVSQDSEVAGHLSDAEFGALTDLLRRYCQYELDQWESWRCRTTYGYVYIDISRERPGGHPEQAYNELPAGELESG